MKKIWFQKALSTVLAAAMAFSLAACGGTESSNTGATAANQSETESDGIGIEEAELKTEENGISDPVDNLTGHDDDSYLSIAITYYDDQISPENGMTTAILKKTLEGSLEEVAGVSYTSQYPLGVYYESDHAIYYSAVDETGNYDQLWRYSIDTQVSEQLTDSLFAINYIIPRENDIFLVAAAKGEGANTPFLFDKNTNELTKVAVDIDINCMLCAYDPVSGRLIISGGSYSEEKEVREQWNEREDENEPYIPADAYIYEIIGAEAELLVHMERFEVKNLAVKSEDEIFFSGKTEKFTNMPKTQYLCKTGESPVECSVFPDDFPLYVYDNFAFVSENELYCIGEGDDSTKYPRGLYHYDISEDSLELIYDGSELGGYVNNFVFLANLYK